MKKIVFAALASLVAIPVFAQQATQTAPVGRYQMIDAQFSGPPDSGQSFKRLAILDTATGVVAVCDYVYQDAGKRSDNREYWSTNGSCGMLITPEPLLVSKAAKGARK